jgi:hypothetical protein
MRRWILLWRDRYACARSQNLVNAGILLLQINSQSGVEALLISICLIGASFMFAQVQCAVNIDFEAFKR